ncbi:MAG: HAD family phosphatase [Deltaproteobacteria bacterium]|nr:HAD family phosphatase [Deltaproteobacteria bacterium]
MKENNTFALIWDMDGTMVDTRKAHWLAWKQILSAEKYDLTWETFLKTFGQRNDTILRSLFGAGLSDAEVVRIGDAKEEAFREVLKGKGVKLLPGAGQIIDQAKTKGWPQVVVSSAPRKNINAILKALNLPDTFAALVCAEDVINGKPHPEGCLTASQKIGVSPSNCIVLEDAPAGLLAARNAGMACVGVLSTHDCLSNADRVVNTLEEITLTDLKALVHEHKAF